MEETRTVYVVHAVPGRVRVRLDRPSRPPAFMNSLMESFSALEGVRGVQANPITGSVLLLYDPEVLGVEQLYLAATAVNLDVQIAGLGQAPEPNGEPSPVARSIDSAFGRLNSAVADLSGGRLDAKTLIPLGLAAMSLRRIMTAGSGLGTAPWYMLLWYSFELFTKYNSRQSAHRRD